MASLLTRNWTLIVTLKLSKHANHYPVDPPTTYYSATMNMNLLSPQGRFKEYRHRPTNRRDIANRQAELLIKCLPISKTTTLDSEYTWTLVHNYT